MFRALETRAPAGKLIGEHIEESANRELRSHVQDKYVKKNKLAFSYAKNENVIVILNYFKSNKSHLYPRIHLRNM